MARSAVALPSGWLLPPLIGELVPVVHRGTGANRTPTPNPTPTPRQKQNVSRQFDAPSWRWRLLGAVLYPSALQPCNDHVNALLLSASARCLLLGVKKWSSMLLRQRRIRQRVRWPPHLLNAYFFVLKCTLKLPFNLTLCVCVCY